jgi:hypothetical protein
MSGDRPATDLGVEREIDLRRFKDAAFAYWWVAVAGLVGGLILGGLYALSGGTSTYTASATIARGEAFSPSGASVVLSYLSSPVTIATFATNGKTVDKVAKKVGIAPGQLNGHITVSTLTAEGLPSPVNTGSTLLDITVELKKPKPAEDAANYLAILVKNFTTSKYVNQGINLVNVKIAYLQKRLVTLQQRVNYQTEALAKAAGLTPLDKLVVSTQLDASEATLGQTIDSLTAAQQQLTLAQDVEVTQIVTPAAAERLPATSRRNGVAVGGLLGLILGAIAGMIYGLRAGRKRTAQP